MPLCLVFKGFDWRDCCPDVRLVIIITMCWYRAAAKVLLIADDINRRVTVIECVVIQYSGPDSLHWRQSVSIAQVELDKNLAIANRSRVSCARNTSNTSTASTVTPWPWNLDKRSLKVIKTGVIRKLGCGFLFAFHSNHGAILYRLRHNHDLLVENRKILATPSEFREDVWCW